MKTCLDSLSAAITRASRRILLLLCCGASFIAIAAGAAAATIPVPPEGGSYSGSAYNPSPTDYSWTPNSDGEMTLGGSGDGCCAITYIEVNGVAYGGPFNATKGTTYLIRVSTNNGANTTLYWTFKARPVNDDFADAIDISAAPYDAYGGSLEGSAEVATDELPSNDPPPAGDVWFRWSVPEDGQVNFSGNCGGACDVGLVVYRGTSLSDLVNVSGGEAFGAQVQVTANTLYHVAMRARPGGYSLGWAFTPKTSNGPRRLWTAGRDLLANEKRNDAAEQTAVNARIPEWSYGTRAQAATTELNLFRPELHENGSNGFEGWSSSGAAEGVLGVNAKTTPLHPGFNAGQVFPQQLFLHPTSSNAFVVARWTASEDGWYRVYAEWRDLDSNGGNGASAHVVINGREVFGRKVPADQFGPERFVGLEWNDGGNAAMAAETFKLNAGDVVDFALGSRGDARFDSTTFNAIVRRVPGVEITNAPPQTRTDEGVQLPEGTDVTLEVAVDSPRPVTSATLLVNGTAEATDTSAPFSLTQSNMRPGAYYMSVKVVDSEGVESISEQIKVRVLPIPATSAVRRAKGGDQEVAAASTGQFFVCTQSGAWGDPATWGGAGVPGRNDGAVIYAGFAVHANDVEVNDLDLHGSLFIGSPDAPRRFVVYGTLLSKGLVQGGDASSQLVVFNRLSSVSGVTKFRDLSVFVSGTFVVTNNGGIDAPNCVIVTSGRSSFFSAPGTNRPTVVRADQVQLTGGLHSLGTYAQIIAPAGVISTDGAGLIGTDGATLIGTDGATLIGTDGATLIGTDGASLIGTDGASLIGTDGATLIGTDGATLIGTDGATILSDAVAGIRAPDNKKARASAGTATNAVGYQAIGGSSRKIILESGTVSGTINLIGDVLNSGAFISPGAPTGEIKVDGDYTQEAGGTVVLDVGGTQTTPLQFDQLQITGSANLAGKLIVKTIDGFNPGPGATFSPLSFSARSGNFESISSNAQITFGATGMTMQVSGPNPPAPKTLNIATRMRVETGDNVLIAGFIITGDAPKKVLIRGIGPSLPVEGALADPTLDVDGGTFFNDNWRSDQAGDIEATTIPPSSELESAIVATLDPGAHTAVLRGSNDGTGVGLVEVYDLETGSPVQLANISTRGQVQTGDNVMIGGFIIGGEYPAKVLLRAIGPSLPVEGKLQDPTLELVDGQGNTISNDNWRATQEAEIVATTVPPTNDREAAIVATLVPGAYTAVVRGQDDTIGVALVEGYNLE